MLLLQLTHPLHSPATCSPGAVFIIYNLGVALSGVRHACASSEFLLLFDLFSLLCVIAPGTITARCCTARYVYAGVKFRWRFSRFLTSYSVVQRGLQSLTLYRVGHAYTS